MVPDVAAVGGRDAYNTWKAGGVGHSLHGVVAGGCYQYRALPQRICDGVSHVLAVVGRPQAEVDHAGAFVCRPTDALGKPEAVARARRVEHLDGKDPANRRHAHSVGRVHASRRDARHMGAVSGVVHGVVVTVDEVAIVGRIDPAGKLNVVVVEPSVHNRNEDLGRAAGVVPCERRVDARQPILLRILRIRGDVVRVHAHQRLYPEHTGKPLQGLEYRVGPLGLRRDEHALSVVGCLLGAPPGPRHGRADRPQLAVIGRHHPLLRDDFVSLGAGLGLPHSSGTHFAAPCTLRSRSVLGALVRLWGSWPGPRNRKCASWQRWDHERKGQGHRDRGSPDLTSLSRHPQQRLRGSTLSLATDLRREVCRPSRAHDGA